MNIRWKTGFILVLVILGCGLGRIYAETVTPIVRTEIPPRIDGLLDDAAWKTAFKVSEFKTYEPVYNKDPQQRTVAYLTYDAHNLYFAAFCYDTQVNKIKGSVTKRDNIFGDDWFAFLIDTFNNKQTAYAFFINPLGIQADGMMNLAGNVNDSHDMVWYSKGHINKKGFCVEARIPLESIRFPSGKTQVMRVGFFRQLVRYSENASCPAINPERGSILRQAAPVSLTGLKYKRVVEFIPAFTYSLRKEHEEGVLATTENQADLSLTAKVGLSSDLVLDAAVNPDFSQVESDAGQVDVNLRYDLFFSEKRPFFLEGNELFEFSGNTEDAPLIALVHTRNIINPSYGIKLTGKLGNKNAVAALYSRDKVIDGDDTQTPHFSIFRFRRALKDDSYIGGFFTRKDAEDSYNMIVGTDGRIRLSKLSVGEFHLFGSFSKTPDSEEVLNGHALGLSYSYETKKIMVDLGLQDIAKNFQVDTGFITRTDITRLAGFAMYQFYPKSKLFKKVEPFYWSYHLYDKTHRMWETFNLFTLRCYLPLSTQIRFDSILANEVYEGFRFTRSGFGIQTYTQLTKKIYLGLFYRYQGKIYYDPDDPYQGFGNSFSFDVLYQPLEKLSTSLSLVYSDFYRDADSEKIYDYGLIRNRTTLQLNKYLYFRVIAEYNTYRKKLTGDVLASFTYIPGTVVYLGYGSAFEKLKWENREYVEHDDFMETKRGFFFKVSYLWRL